MASEVHMEGFFEIVIVGASWHSTDKDGGICSFPQAVATELATEIKSWYESLNADVRGVVGEVRVTPPHKPCPNSAHVSVNTLGFGGESNLRHVPRREEGFIYNLDTKSVGISRRNQRSLAESLDDALGEILTDELSLMKHATQVLQDGLNAIRKETPSDEDK